MSRAIGDSRGQADRAASVGRSRLMARPRRGYAAELSEYLHPPEASLRPHRAAPPVHPLNSEILSSGRAGVQRTRPSSVGRCSPSRSLKGLAAAVRSLPRDVLRHCFLLVPSPTVSRRQNDIHVREIILPPDPAAAPHAHHGHGWRRPWRLVDKTASVAVLEYRHVPDEWPWAYVATQRITLIDAGAEIELSVTNESTEDMPAGLGLHPYFARVMRIRSSLAPRGWS